MPPSFPTQKLTLKKLFTQQNSTFAPILSPAFFLYQFKNITFQVDITIKLPRTQLYTEINKTITFVSHHWRILKQEDKAISSFRNKPAGDDKTATFSMCKTKKLTIHTFICT